jgi:hypothetical protein
MAILIVCGVNNEYKREVLAIEPMLEEELEDALTYLSFPQLDSRKVSSNNMLERLNREIRRRTKVVGIFPSYESYLRLVTMYLIKYSEDWSVTKAYLSKGSHRHLTNRQHDSSSGVQSCELYLPVPYDLMTLCCQIFFSVYR